MAGTLAALGSMNIHLLVALLIVAAILGVPAIPDWPSCRRALVRQAGFADFRREYLNRTEAFYARPWRQDHCAGAFCADCAHLCPFVAGMGHMAYLQFARFNVLGAVLWVLRSATPAICLAICRW